MFHAAPALLALAIGLGAAAERRPASTELHVAPNGNDRGPGTKERPFQSLEKARDAARALKARQPVRVLIHGGTYHRTAPFVLTPDDSGTADHPISYEAAGDGRPVFSGGRRITGWNAVTVTGRKVWAAQIPDVRAGKWLFHQLWVNGQRRPRARRPNDGFFRIVGLPDAKPNTPYDQGQNRFQFRPGDLKHWDNLTDVDVIVLPLWVSARLPVTSIDEQRHLATLGQKSRFKLADGPEAARYYVENALELLDTPGEWYLNRRTGVLYYWPKPSEDLTKAEVIAPSLPLLVRFAGKPEDGRSVEHVTLRGLTFQYCEWWPARTDPVDGQAAVKVPALIRADGARHCALVDCTISHASNYAIHLASGCQDDRTEGCEVFDLGAGGIMVGETKLRSDPRQQTHGNTVTDNRIHDCGQVFPQAVGIWIGQSDGNRVTHNHIHHLYYTGISCGWTWGYGRTLARDNLIAFNLVHDIGRGLLSDMGGVYTLGIQPGTVVRGNVFHDIAAHRYGGWGIYFDEGSSNIVAEDNLIYRTTHGGFHQHYGRDNVVRNNVFALGRDAQLRRSRVEPHRSFTFEHNLVWYDRGDLLQGSWDDGGVSLDHNLYWRAGGTVRFGNDTWDQWRARGRDQHSLIADPLFTAPEKGDFRLKAGSPAQRVGFKITDWSSVGPRPPNRRGSAR